MVKQRLCGIFLLAGLLVLTSCGDRNRQVDDSPVIASSGTATLHLSEINSIIAGNQSLELSKIQVHNFIQRWSEKELVYQQALAEEFDRHPEIQKKLLELKKDFVVAAYLNDKIDSQLTVSESEIQSYYNEKGSEFIREHDYYNIQLMLLPSSSEAYKIRRSLLNGEDFETLAKENSLDPSRENGGNLGWVMPEALPSQVARRLPNLALNSISTPISTSVGEYLILVHDVREKGKVQTLEEVRDIIEWRIKARDREDSYKELVNQLREKDHVDIKWNYLDSLNIEG